MGGRLRVVVVLGSLTLAIPGSAFAANVWGAGGATPDLARPGSRGLAGAVGSAGRNPGPGRAGWHIVPSGTLKELYTDNVTLAPPGSEKSDFVTEITPGFRLFGDTRRLKLNLYYQMQNLIYANNSNFNKTNNLLQLGSTAELIKNHGFLDFNVHRRPQNISNTGRIAFDNASVTNNLSTATTVSVSPYWTQRFGSFASAVARYTFDTVQSGSSAAFASSDRNSVEASMQSGARFYRLQWALFYHRQDITYAGLTRSTKLEEETAQLKYLITPHIALIGTLGYDSNSYQRASGLSTSGANWSVGAQWNPSHRTTVEGTVGRRYFGTTYSFDLKHRTRLTDWVASYTENPSTTRTTLLEQVLFPVVDAFGNPILNPSTGEPIELSAAIPTQTTQTVINKTFDTTFQFRLPHHTLQLSLLQTTRDYQLTANSESVLTTSARWTWMLGYHTHVDTTLRWIQNELQFTGRDDYALGQVALTRNLSPTLVATASYRYLQRNSNRPGANYTENRIYVLLSKSF